jgi:hypothetical protein
VKAPKRFGRGHSPHVAEAKRRLAETLELFRKGRRELLAIARFLHNDPACKQTVRRQRAGEEWADSLAYNIEGACISIARDYLTKDVILPLEDELRLTLWECIKNEERNEERHRHIVESIERRKAEEGTAKAA